MDHFIVSARKYRPASFRSVVGQAHITSTLKNAITRGQLAHAYLFCGPRGVGKTTCARIFAKAINCLTPVEGEACNECESCRAFNEGRSFSIHELDAASNNSVDDIRNLTEQVRIPPQVGRYSVYIIDEVHMLSLSAFNAFLKTLEEPPAHAVFILATTEKHKIIPTILSRCQIYDFNRIRVEDGVDYLKLIASKEGVGYDEEALHIIAQKADGGMRDALSMFDKVVSFCGNQLKAPEVADTLNVLDYDTYFKATALILDGNYSEVLLLFDDVLRRGFGGQSFISGLNEHMRNLLMCKNPQTLPLLEVSGKIAERYSDQAVHCTIPFLFESVNLLTTLDAGFRTATNQRLHVELGLMKLCGMGQKKKVVEESSDRENTVPRLPDPIDASGENRENSRLDRLPERNGVSVSEKNRNPVREKMSPSGPGKTKSSEVPPAKYNPGIPVSGTESSGRSGEAVPLPVNGGSIVPTAVSDPSVGTRPGTTASGSSITGFSLKALIGSPESKETAETAEEEEKDSELMEEATEELLIRAAQEIVRELKQDRPRLAVAFTDVPVTGNRFFFTVPNESLKDEIERNAVELQKRLKELAGIRGGIEFSIRIDRSIVSDKPVNPEEKLRYLAGKNPAVEELKRALGLDID